MNKSCSSCGISKSLSDFVKGKSQCKSCKSVYRKAYYEKNKEQENAKCWLRANPNKDISERAKYRSQDNSGTPWRERNIVEYREYQRNYQTNKLKSDPLFALKKRVRQNIRRALVNGKLSKKSKTIEILGCSFDDFYTHIEKQFNSGMSWENMHLWEIDHIIPLSWAKSETEILTLSRYSNLQPLWTIDNRIKSNRYTSLLPSKNA